MEVVPWGNRHTCLGRFDINNNHNDFIFIALFHVKHAQLR